MGMIERLKNKWSCMSTNEKAKIILRFLCDIGGGILANKIGAQYTKDEPWIIRKAVGLTTFGLGSAVGNAASNELNDLVDVIIPEKKNEEIEEEEANA